MAQDDTSHVTGTASDALRHPASAHSDKIPETGDPTPKAGGPSVADRLLQAPVLTAGEKMEDYRALEAQILAAMQPQTFFERLHASDVCHALWEEQRFRRQQAALPGATGMKALVCLLASIGFEKDALDIATSYFGEDDDERSNATALIRRFNITDDAINAQASQQNLPILSTLEHLMANRQSRRDVVVSEYHRRKRKADKLTARKSVAEPQSDRPATARH
ncbi:hypothetical protein [Bradyrhizobium sp.]|uniref:hypothetical protein n=1 Tax=Bradyrhizobium sp. TaxID=376 RepID=UPI0025C648DE|nr:hypothetical protein [Bradyrhizobium sp.]